MKQHRAPRSSRRVSHPNQEVRRQYGALPYRRTLRGDFQVLLITSRDTGRWIIPKGWPMHWLSAAEAAAQEAFEEAGVAGIIGTEPIGSYGYLKRLKRGRDVPCEVVVFPLHVVEDLTNWPERQERARCWVAPQKAASCVEERDLAALILAAESRIETGDDEALLSWNAGRASPVERFRY